MEQVNPRPEEVTQGPGDLLRILTISIFLLAVVCLPLQAASEQNLEYQVKAAFLLNFTKFIEWPPAAFADSGAPFNICIVGADPFGRLLEQLVEGETVNSRKLMVHRIIPGPVPKSCQILFIGKAETDLPNLLNGLGPGVLSVGEGPGFLRDGGMIAFVLENRRVRFDINQTAAENASLNLSSKLLNVARSVEK